VGHSRDAGFGIPEAQRDARPEAISDQHILCGRDSIGSDSVRFTEPNDDTGRLQTRQ
jgi:hypothetical protein